MKKYFVKDFMKNKISYCEKKFQQTILPNRKIVFLFITLNIRA